MNSELKDLIEPNRSAVIVIDVQNDCCHSEGAYAKSGMDISLRQKAAHNAAEFIKEARMYKVPIIYTKVSHSQWDESPPQLRLKRQQKTTEACIKGTWGEDFYAVQPLEDEAIVVKHRYSAFKGSDLDMILRSKRITTLIVTGGGTPACVESTVRDGFELDYDIIVVSDCCGTPTIKEHEPALRRMAWLCGTLAEAKEILEVWSQEY